MKEENGMLLTEEHVIRCGRQERLFRKTDGYCYCSKNLYNSTNYLIVQCARISRKLKDGEILDSWEKGLIHRINCAIHCYARAGSGRKIFHSIDENNGFIADAYFLSWYLKQGKEFREMPYSTCAQIVIQELCRNWKSFYRSMEAWKKDPGAFSGKPGRPAYKDKEKGRNALVLTYQNIKVDKDGKVRLPRFLDGIHIKARHRDIRQVRIQTGDGKIRIQLIYRSPVPALTGKKGIMGIDPGLDNLVTLCMDTSAEPVIINGRGVKSINQYYNKRRASLGAVAAKSNSRKETKRMRALTQKRNSRIKDAMHKVSRKVVQLAQENGVGMIVIGNNKGWKQNVKLGNRTNQEFVSIPYSRLIWQICYKAALAGIETRIVEESYTSGTSYIDEEYPERRCYDRSRRIKRGLFKSNNGILINADVNAAYQIMKKAGRTELRYKGMEKTVRLNVS